MMTLLRSLLSWPIESAALVSGAAAAAWRVLPFAGLAALLWTLHVHRLRSRERRLLRIIERMIARADTADAGRAPADAGCRVPAGAAGGSLSEARVLVVGTSGERRALLRRLEAMGVAAACADSTWAAGVACREALGAGAPYNLVLLQAETAEADEAEQLSRFEAGLAGGVRVAVVRAPSRVAALVPEAAGDGADCGQGADAARDEERAAGGWLEEGVGPDEDLDRRGRTGFAAAAAADASALGLRGSRRE